MSGIKVRGFELPCDLDDLEALDDAMQIQFLQEKLERKQALRIRDAKRKEGKGQPVAFTKESEEAA